MSLSLSAPSLSSSDLLCAEGGGTYSREGVADQFKAKKGRGLGGLENVHIQVHMHAWAWAWAWKGKGADRGVKAHLGSLRAGLAHGLVLFNDLDLGGKRLVAGDEDLLEAGDDVVLDSSGVSAVEGLEDARELGLKRHDGRVDVAFGLEELRGQVARAAVA